MGRPPYASSNSEGGRKYEITHLWQKQHEIKRYVLLGFGNKEIARIMKCTPQNISDIRNSEVFQNELRVLEVARDSDTIDIAKTMKEDNGKSLKLVREVRDDINHPISLRLKAAIDLLDRSPETAKVKSIQGELIHSYLGPEEVDKIKAAAKEAKQLMMGSIVDAEIEEVTEDIDLSSIDSINDSINDNNKEEINK